METTKTSQSIVFNGKNAKRMERKFIEESRSFSALVRFINASLDVEVEDDKLGTFVLRDYLVSMGFDVDGNKKVDMNMIEEHWSKDLKRVEVDDNGKKKMTYYVYKDTPATYHDFDTNEDYDVWYYIQGKDGKNDTWRRVVTMSPNAIPAKGWSLAIFLRGLHQSFFKDDTKKEMDRKVANWTKLKNALYIKNIKVSRGGNKEKTTKIEKSRVTLAPATL